MEWKMEILIDALQDVEFIEKLWSGALAPCKFIDERNGPQPVPRRLVLSLAKHVADAEAAKARETAEETATAGIGAVSGSMTQMRDTDIFVVNTNYISHVIVDDPVKMGRIACASLLSDFFAVGIVNCDNVLMQMTVSERTSEEQRKTFVPAMVSGFQDWAVTAGSKITIDKTVFDPFTSIGGVATALSMKKEILMPYNAVDGDVLVLTKPLGSGVAVWGQYLMDSGLGVALRIELNSEMVKMAYSKAVQSMGRLNMTAGKLLHKYKAHASIDMNGSGILCLAQALAAMQHNSVDFHIYTLPVIKNTTIIAETCGLQLTAGLATEYSGGLLVAMSRHLAAKYVAQLLHLDGHHAWIIGIVKTGTRTAQILKKPRIIEYI